MHKIIMHSTDEVQEAESDVWAHTSVRLDSVTVVLSFFCSIFN